MISGLFFPYLINCIWFSLLYCLSTSIFYLQKFIMQILGGDKLKVRQRVLGSVPNEFLAIALADIAKMVMPPILCHRYR